MKTDLTLPVLDLSPYDSVVLEFRSDFTVYFTGQSGQAAPFASVDYQINGGSWSNVWQRAAVFSPGPVLERLDLSRQLGGRSGVKLAFYYQANYDWWWQVDNVRVIVTPSP